jgi:hypothetical protein
MKATPIVLQILAISVIALILIPQFVKAEVIGEKEVLLNAPSIHASEYDETVNIANDSARQNDQTWDPTYQGIWVGGSTKESLFKFNYVTTDYSSMCLSWEAKFSRTKIMNGASDWVVRLPIYSSVDDIYFATLTVYKIPSSNSYSFHPRSSLYAPDFYGVNITFTDPANTYKIYQPCEKGSYLLDPSDVHVTDGNDYYTIDNRLYVQCRAPIVADTLYLFQVEISYKADSRFKVYLSPNDVASDGLFNSYISTYIIEPGSYQYQSSNYTLDLGFSFDFRIGLGGNMVSKNFWLENGDIVSFWCYVPQGGMTYGYHSIMIPFRTANGSAQFGSFNIFSGDAGAGSPLWTAYDMTTEWFRDYILVSSDTAFNVSINSNEANYFEVQFLSARDQSVTFAFEDLPETKDGFTTSALDYYGMVSNRTDMSFISNYILSMHIYSSYLITDNQLPTPIIASLSSWSEKFSHDYPRDTVWDYVAYGLLIAGGILLTTAAFLVAPIVGVAVIAGYATGTLLAYYGPQIAAAFGQWVSEIAGLVGNAIDWAWNALRGIGEFLWSIGEGIYNILKWAYEIIVEYGTIILGLLIIGVAMLLFFYPIHYQLKLWKVVLFMAQGRLEQADALMMSTGREGARDIRYAGRVGRRAYRRGSKGFSGMADRFRKRGGQ